jgi:thymidine kinase
VFSGKSEELIRRLRRATIARKRVQVFKPVIDTRYSAEEIVSHGDLRMKSEVLNSGGEILDRVDWRSEAIGVDEANFMGESLVDVVQRLADSGKQVIVAGLDTDYLGRPFVPIPDLLCLAESITKTLAICVRCGNPAKHTQRLRGAEDLIVLHWGGELEAGFAFLARTRGGPFGFARYLAQDGSTSRLSLSAVLVPPVCWRLSRIGIGTRIRARLKVAEQIAKELSR